MYTRLRMFKLRVNIRSLKQWWGCLKFSVTQLSGREEGGGVGWRRLPFHRVCLSAVKRKVNKVPTMLPGRQRTCRTPERVDRRNFQGLGVDTHGHESGKAWHPLAKLSCYPPHQSEISPHPPPPRRPTLAHLWEVDLCPLVLSSKMTRGQRHSTPGRSSFDNSRGRGTDNIIQNQGWWLV